MRTVVSPSAEAERGGDGGRWRHETLLEDTRVDDAAQALDLLGEAQQAEGVVGQLGIGDEGADAMPHNEVSAADEDRQRLPRRHAADARPLRQLPFGGELVVRGQGAGADALADRLGELVVEGHRARAIEDDLVAVAVRQAHAGSPIRSSTRSRKVAMCCSFVT